MRLLGKACLIPIGLPYQTHRIMLDHMAKRTTPPRKTPRKKTWSEKMDNGRKPEVVRIEKAYAGIPVGASVLISTPHEVDAFIKKIPEGRFVTAEELRCRLAAKHGADAACPLLTGILLRIVSEAGWERIQEGEDSSHVTPFWRVVKRGSTLAKKLACGETFIARMQRHEGIER